MDEEVKLPFNRVKQQALLGHLLNERKFFLFCQEQILPEWFTEDAMCAKVYAIQRKWWNTYRQFPSIEEIKGSPAVMAEPLSEQQRISNHIVICLNAKTSFHLEPLTLEIEDWLKSVIFRRGLEKVVNTYNNSKHDLSQVEVIWNETNREVQKARFDQKEFVDFGQYAQDFKQILEGREGALTTGSKVLDRALIDGPSSGGLLPGNTTIFVAPTNVGKTTTLITVAQNNISRNKDVLFMSHEGGPEELKMKMWCSFLNKTTQELVESYSNPDMAGMLASFSNLLNEHLHYKPINKAGMTVEYVATIIERLQEEHIDRTGHGYHMIISDYPAKLTTDKAAKGNLPRREIDRIVYDYYVQMALEHKFHAVLAIQTNREGSRVNRGQRDRRLLTREDVAESWGTMEIADNVITINRPPRAVEEGWVTFYVDKCRSSQTGTAVVCKSDYSRCRTHSDELGAIWYRNNSTMDGRVNDLLKEHNTTKGGSGAVPEQMVFGLKDE